MNINVIYSEFFIEYLYIDLYDLAIMSTIMIGAILMHLKVKDPIKKLIPAITMLTMYSMIFSHYILQLNNTLVF